MGEINGELLARIRAGGDLCTFPDLLGNLEEMGLHASGKYSLFSQVEGAEVIYWAGLSSEAIALLESMINAGELFLYPVERAIYEARDDWIDCPNWNPVKISTAPVLSLAELIQKQVAYIKKNGGMNHEKHSSF